MSTAAATLQRRAPSDRAGDGDDVAVLDDPLEQQRFTRWTIGADGQRMADSTLQLSGMTCAACAGIIEQALMGVDGVADARVSAAGQRAAVRWDPQLTRASRLVQAVRAAGYDAAPDAAAPARELRRAESRQALWRLFVAAFCMMQVMMLATPSYVAGPGELDADLARLLNWGSWVLSLPVLLFSAGPFFSGLGRALRQRRISMDVPVALGVAVTFIASTGATFDPGGLFGHEVYFDSMTMFVSFLLAARFLELHARHRAMHALEAALDRMPQQAERLLGDGRSETVSVMRLAPGDSVRVALGQPFPADGSLLDGRTRVDESLLTGESTPVAKVAGDALVGGSINLGAPVTMTVQRVGADTRHEAIVALMRDAMTQRPELARMADRWAGPFTWGVLLLSVGAAAVWSVIDPSRAVWVAVAVLIVTCPCALSLSVPAALVAAAGGLARRGVLVQRLDALESMAQLDRLFIDKTGTLTTQALQLHQARVLRPGAGLSTPEQALSVAAGLAAWSSHPLSVALSTALSAAQSASGNAAAPVSVWTDVQEMPGRGLRGRDAQGTVWRLGSAEWADADADAGAASGAAAGATADARAGVWLAADGGALASFAFDEALRDGAIEAMAALRQQGYRLSLLSGDSPARAHQLAQQLQLHDAIGGATPQDKLDAVAQAQRQGQRVAMIGDGVNDAPVLALADVSMAMGQGALVARAQADAVLVGSRPMDIVYTLAVARKAMRIVRQNLRWALAYNVACVPLAVAGVLPPWAAGLGMALSSLFVVGNALRVAR